MFKLFPRLIDDHADDQYRQVVIDNQAEDRQEVQEDLQAEVEAHIDRQEDLRVLQAVLGHAGVERDMSSKAGEETGMVGTECTEMPKESFYHSRIDDQNIEVA